MDPSACVGAAERYPPVAVHEVSRTAPGCKSGRSREECDQGDEGGIGPEEDDEAKSAVTLPIARSRTFRNTECSTVANLLIPTCRAPVSAGGGQIVSFASSDCGVDHGVFCGVDRVSGD